MPREMPLFAAHPTGFTEARQQNLSRGVCVHVVDGDTFDVLTDLGFLQSSLITIRLRGVDTPELNSGDLDVREKAISAKQRVSKLILDQPVLLRTYKDTRSFGRYVADVWTHCNVLTDSAKQSYQENSLLISNHLWLSLKSILLVEKHGKPL